MRLRVIQASSYYIWSSSWKGSTFEAIEALKNDPYQGSPMTEYSHIAPAGSIQDERLFRSDNAI